MELSWDVDLNRSPLKYIQGEVCELNIDRHYVVRRTSDNSGGHSWDVKDRFPTYTCNFRLTDVPDVCFEYESKWNPYFEEGQSVVLVGHFGKEESAGHAKFDCFAYKDKTSGKIRSKAFLTPLIVGFVTLPIGLVFLCAFPVLLTDNLINLTTGSSPDDNLGWEQVIVSLFGRAIATAVGAGFLYFPIKVIRARRMLSGLGPFPSQFDISVEEIPRSEPDSHEGFDAEDEKIEMTDEEIDDESIMNFLKGIEG